MLKKYKYGKQARNFPVVRFWVKGEGVFFWEKRSLQNLGFNFGQIWPKSVHKKKIYGFFR